jgi:hypothetical protein
MNRSIWIFCFLSLTLALLVGCSSRQQAAKKAAVPLDRIQGTAQVLVESTGATDAALNAGGPSVYVWEGARRYRLFLRTPIEVVHGLEYVVEGVYAQKAIDALGDPDQGKNGYPLQSSCNSVVRMAWSDLSFDDTTSATVRTRVNRYPARPLFLVTKIRLATDADHATAAGEPKKGGAEEKSIPEIAVAAEKQQALLIEGPTVQPAPLWEPAGGTVRCKVLIGPEGKIAELDTGAQLCESVSWSQFRYQPAAQSGRPVKVKTEVEVRFEPRK